MILLPEAIIVHIARFSSIWTSIRLVSRSIKQQIDKSDAYIETIIARQKYEHLADSCLLGKNIETLLYLRRYQWHTPSPKIWINMATLPLARCTAITIQGRRCRNMVKDIYDRCHHHKSFPYYIKDKKASILKPPIFVLTSRISPAPVILAGRL